MIQPLSSSSSPSDAAEFECRLDGREGEKCESGQTYPELEEDEYTFVVTPKSEDGQLGEPDEHTWTVDTTPPTTRIERPETDSSSIRVTFIANETARFTCWLQGQAPVECTSPHTFPDLESGKGYVILVQATDVAGNEGNEAKTKAVVMPPPPPPPPAVDKPSDEGLKPATAGAD